MRRRVQALGRLPAGTMNRTEAAYARHLEARKAAGEVAWFEFGTLSLKLAPSTHYRPDFLVMLAGGELEVHEVKGHWQEDAWAKTKIAAGRFPFRFVVVKARTRAQGGGWDVEPIGGELA